MTPEERYSTLKKYKRRPLCCTDDLRRFVGEHREQGLPVFGRVVRISEAEEASLFCDPRFQMIAKTAYDPYGISVYGMTLITDH